jgi:hypothetical protein
LKNFKIVTTGHCPTNSLAERPAHAVIQINEQGVAQLAGLYALARRAEPLGIEDISAWPCGGLSVRWREGLSDADLEGSFMSPECRGACSDEDIGYAEGGEDWNESSGEDSIEGEKVVVMPDQFYFRGTGSHSDNVFESGPVYWHAVPELKEAVEEALRRATIAGEAFPELDWNRTREVNANKLPTLPPPPFPVEPGLLKSKAFVLVQESEYGMDVAAFPTRQAAESDLLAHVAENWSRRPPGDTPDDISSLSSEDAIAAYFDGNENESYDLREIEVGLPASPSSQSAKVFVLIQEDGVERTASVFPTARMAESRLHGYVVENWDARAGKNTPADPSSLSVEDALSAYFDGHEDENYDLMEVEPCGFTLAQSKEKLLALVFQYEPGEAAKVNLCRSQGEAEKILHDLAIENWSYRDNRNAPEDPSSLSRDQAIGAYFEGNAYISYSIQDVDLPLSGLPADIINEKTMQTNDSDSYKQLLQKCLSALNQIPNKKLCDGSTTYKLAFEIEDLFRGEAVQSTEMAAVGAEVGEEIEEEEEFEMRM